MNQELIGRKSEKRKIIVERGQLKLFAKAINETNPIYLDEQAAMQAGYPDVLAAPTFASCLGLLAPSKSLSYASLGIDCQTLLHTEEKIESIKLIHAGDHLTLTSEVVDVYEKKGGALQCLEMLTSVTRGSELIQKVTATLVMRQEFD